MNGRQQVDKLDVKQLDKKLQAMAPTARNELIAQKIEERRVLQEIARLAERYRG